MKKTLLIFLVVLALLSFTGIASAQGGAQLKAVTVAAVTLYAEPSDTAEVVAELPASSVVTLLKTSEDGAWFEVEAAEGTGYAPASSFAVLTPGPLAPKGVVTSTGANAPLFAEANLGSEFIGELTLGQMATILGSDGQLAYVMTADGMSGWTVATALEELPADAQPALVSVSSDQLGVFAETSITSDVAGTLANGDLVYIYNSQDEWVELKTPEGATGYALVSSFVPVAKVYVDTLAGEAATGIFSEADFGAEVLGDLPGGMTLFYLSSVDDFWTEVYAPGIGTGYALKATLSNPYTTATVRYEDAIVRAGPNDSIFNIITRIPTGTEVVVAGKDASGTWIQVAVPYSAIEFPYRGVSGWMRDWLFVGAQGVTDLDVSLLAVTAE